MIQPKENTFKSRKFGPFVHYVHFDLNDAHARHHRTRDNLQNNILKAYSCYFGLSFTRFAKGG